jgi:hypothetical protein
MDCSTCHLAGTPEGLLRTLQEERQTITHLLREETAQTVSALLLQLASLSHLQDVTAIHERLDSLRDELRPELAHIQAHVAEIDRRWQLTCRLPLSHPCEVMSAET